MTGRRKINTIVIKIMANVLNNVKLLLSKMKKIDNSNKEKAIILLICMFVYIAFVPCSFAWTEEYGDTSMLRYYAIDVGQGDCTFFAFPNGKNMLVDTGTPKSFDAIDEFLRKHKVKKIDLLVITHPHSDHIGSASEIVGNYLIGEIWQNGYPTASPLQEKFEQTIKEYKCKTIFPKVGEERNFGRALVQVVAPKDGQKGRRKKNMINNDSLVLLVSYHSHKFFMTGDMEEQERETLSLTEPQFQDIAVLKVAHHGSRTGTDLKMLQQIRPKIMTFSYAESNPYNVPHKEVIDAINEYNNNDCIRDKQPKIVRYNTVDGTICIASDGEKLYHRNCPNGNCTQQLKVGTAKEQTLLAKLWCIFKRKLYSYKHEIRCAGTTFEYPNKVRLV